MSVLDNVMLPLAYTDVPRREREMRAVHALRSVGLPVDHYDHRTNEPRAARCNASPSHVPL